VRSKDNVLATLIDSLVIYNKNGTKETGAVVETVLIKKLIFAGKLFTFTNQLRNYKISNKYNHLYMRHYQATVSEC
jgi:hypothetical protein